MTHWELQVSLLFLCFAFNNCCSVPKRKTSCLTRTGLSGNFPIQPDCSWSLLLEGTSLCSLIYCSSLARHQLLKKKATVSVRVTEGGNQSCALPTQGMPSALSFVQYGLRVAASLRNRLLEECTEVNQSDPDHLWALARNLYSLTDSVKSPDFCSWSMENVWLEGSEGQRFLSTIFRTVFQHEFPIWPSCTSLGAQSRCCLQDVTLRLQHPSMFLLLMILFEVQGLPWCLNKWRLLEHI